MTAGMCIKWEGYIILPALCISLIFLLLGCVFKYGFPETYFAIGSAIMILTLAFWVLITDLKRQEP